MDKICLSGSLALLWRKDVDVGLMSYSQNHIDVEVVLPGEEQKWRFTGFYGFSEQNLRYRSWDLLRDLQGRSSLPWVVGGDFNEILADVEKSRGGARSPGLMNAFREVFSDCGLSNLDFSGVPFTCSNNRVELTQSDAVWIVSVATVSGWNWHHRLEWKI